MREIEEVLSLDLEDNDYQYRIRRGKRVVYVSVLYVDIIPLEDRTDSARILSNLRKVPKWNEQWRTLTIIKSHQGVECTTDKFQPHALNIRATAAFSNSERRYNLLDFEPRDRISDRVSRVVKCKEVYILKIARFEHELVALEMEIKAYCALMKNKFTLTPRFIGYVYEEEKDRVMGFLIEDINGRHPGIGDLGTCQSTVRKLHSTGIIHGDLNKYNIIITGKDAKLIDFEAWRNFVHQKEASDELQKLTENLLDSSEHGLH